MVRERSGVAIEPNESFIGQSFVFESLGGNFVGWEFCWAAILLGDHSIGRRFESVRVDNTASTNIRDRIFAIVLDRNDSAMDEIAFH